MGAKINMEDPGELEDAREDDINELGTWGILREAYNILSMYYMVFVFINFTLMLPLALLAVALDFIIYRTFPPQDLRSNFELLLLLGDSEIRFSVGLALCLLLIAALMISFEAAVSLSSAAMVHIVGRHYAGHSVHFQEVLRAAIPNLWICLTVTNIYKTLFLYPMFILQTLGSLLLLMDIERVEFGSFRLALVGTLGMAGAVCFETIFMLAGGVSVLEKDCNGWAAVKRSVELLKGRLSVAISLQLLFLFPTFCLVAVQSIFRYRSSFGEDGFLVMPLAVPCIYFMTYIWQMKAVCAGIQYESFKAFHNEESTGEPIYEKGAQNLRSYERVGSAIEDPKVEQQAESLV